MEIHYKFNTKSSNIYICHQNHYSENLFILVKNIRQNAILGTPFITQIYHFKADQNAIHTSIMRNCISFKFVDPKDSISSNNIDMIRVNEKYILKQEKVQTIRRLELIQKDKDVIFKLLKDIDERLLSLVWDVKKSYTQKLITPFEMMQTPPFQERTREISTLLDKAQMLIQSENYWNQNLKITKRALAQYEII